MNPERTFLAVGLWDTFEKVLFIIIIFVEDSLVQIFYEKQIAMDM